MVEAVGGLTTGTQLFYATRKGAVFSPLGHQLGERWLASSRTRACGAPGLDEVSECVEVGQQVLDLFLTEHLAERGHVIPAIANNISDLLIVCRQTALREILFLENAFHAVTFFGARRIRLMATIAALIIDPAACRLLRIQAQFGVALTQLGITGE